MSHTTRVKAVKVMSITALEKAIAVLNSQFGKAISLHTNTGAKVWARSIHCPYVVKIAGCRFDIGLEEDKDGGYTLVYDYHGDEIYKHLGQGRNLAKTPEQKHLMHIGMLMQQYGVQAMMEAGAEAGGLVEQSFNEQTQEQVIRVF